MVYFLIKMLLCNRNNHYKDNWDFYRYGTLVETSSEAHKLGAWEILKRLLAKRAYWKEWRACFNGFDDPPSRELWVRLIAWGLLGPLRIKLPVNTPEFWTKLRWIETICRVQENTIPLNFMDWKLNLYDLTPFGYSIRLHLMAPAIMQTFGLQQYQWKSDTHCIKAVEGDWVIDAGTCFGDVALYFASQVGCEGRVFSFDCCRVNLAIAERNLALCPHLQKRISLHTFALLDHSDQERQILINGPGTRILTSGSPIGSRATETVKTITVDDFVDRKSLTKVSLIKMDIEGSEFPALRGCERTLKKFRPKLAIAVYHGPSDLYNIMSYLNRLRLGYRFRLGHFSIHGEETILFASCELAGNEPQRDLAMNSREEGVGACSNATGAEAAPLL